MFEHLKACKIRAASRSASARSAIERQPLPQAMARASHAVALILLLAAAPAAAESPAPVIPWPIERVVDGDTVVAGGYRIRLLGIQAPEIRGVCEQEKALGRKTRARLEALIAAAGTVELRRGPPGKYSQLQAVLLLDGVNAAAVLIAEGLAVPYDGGKKLGWCGPSVAQ